MEDGQLLETGRVVATHGVHGEVKLEVWADSPAALAAVKTLWVDGRPYGLTARVHGDFVLAKLQGIDSVEAAMALKGKTVYAHRAEVPLPEGAVFLRDLIGLPVETEAGEAVGVLTDVLDYPAGRIFVVRGETEHLIPEKGGFLQSLDPAAGKITVRLIEGM